jgi:membrane protein
MNFVPGDFAKRLYAKIFDDDIIGNAAQVAFYFSFALFPLLLFLLTLFGYILSSADDFRAEFFTYLRQIMPTSAFTLVDTTINEVMTESSGGKLTFGLLFALWSASAGLDALRGALNEVYNLKETRAWWKTKLISISLTLGIGVLVFIALGLIFYGTQMLMWLLPIDSPCLLKPLQWLTLFIVLVMAFALIYNFSPNHLEDKWKWISPGSIIGIILWILFSTGFRVYLQYFDSYAKTYGSLGAVIVLLLWLYLTALVILIGGAINAIFDEESGVDKAATDPKQVGDEKKTAEKDLGEAIQGNKS